MTNVYLPVEGDVVVFPDSPNPGVRTRGFRVFNVWAGGINVSSEEGHNYAISWHEAQEMGMKLYADTEATG